MFYESDLRFFCDTLKKCHIPVTTMDPAASIAERMRALQLPLNFHMNYETAQARINELPKAQPGTLYQLTDFLGCQYLYFSLPACPQKTIMVIGPLMLEAPTESNMLEWSERHNIPPSLQKQLFEYCSNIPLVRDSGQFFALLDTLCERLFQQSGFQTEDVSDLFFKSNSITEDSTILEMDDPLWSMKTMESRYAYENELMDAVSRGHLHKVELLFTNVSRFPLEKRVADPVRNLKNYCIIMNTLLRKAAERGGVHPLYLDRTSSDFAFRLEKQTSQQQFSTLVTDMFRTYCQLVRKHSMKGYSPPVQKAITLIDSDLAGNLNLRSLSQALNVSGSYLSTLFKKETGQTITDYINQRRIQHARHLLETSRLQIQTIAQHCGFEDVHYFSKVFKKLTNETPKSYRAQMQK